MVATHLLPASREGLILDFSDSTLQPFHPPYLGLFLQLSLELLQLLGEGLLAFG